MLEWIRELTLRYTTPDIHCRHRRHECDGGIRNQKRQKNPNSGKLGIRPDHPRRCIDIRFCTVGGLWLVVLSSKFDQNRLSGYRDFRGQNLGSCITLANGLYIQPCTTVQA